MTSTPPVITYSMVLGIAAACLRSLPLKDLNITIFKFGIINLYNNLGLI